MPYLQNVFSMEKNKLPPYIKQDLCYWMWPRASNSVMYQPLDTITISSTSSPHVDDTCQGSFQHIRNVKVVQYTNFMQRNQHKTGQMTEWLIITPL